MARVRISRSVSGAASNLSAAPLVRVCLGGGSAVVVGGTALRTWYAVGPQRSVANVRPGGQNTPVTLGIHLHFFVLQAFSNQTLAARSRLRIPQNPKGVHLRAGCRPN